MLEIWGIGDKEKRLKKTKKKDLFQKIFHTRTNSEDRKEHTREKISKL